MAMFVAVCLLVARKPAGSGAATGNGLRSTALSKQSRLYVSPVERNGRRRGSLLRASVDLEGMRRAANYIMDH